MIKSRPPTTDHRPPQEAKPLAQGAEAKIFLSNNVITKERIVKGYRHPTLDKTIRTRRTKSEAKLLTKALEAKANIPKVLHVDKFNIKLEFIEGDKLSETLNSYPEPKQFKAMQQLGKQLAILHKNNIIHGDLTTSNVILCISPSTSKESFKVYLIDFGLGFISTKIEDKAVDLHLIKQALEAKHFKSPDHLLGQNNENLFKHLIKGYIWTDNNKIVQRLAVVEKRGRYKH